MTTIATKFDLDVQHDPFDDTYSPSASMLQTIRSISELNDLTFRFWAAKTLFVNLNTVSPCAEAEEVVIYVVNVAIKAGQPTDGSYRLLLDPDGRIQGVAYEDQSPDEPDDFDYLIFDIVCQPDREIREAGLVELAIGSALTAENAALDEPLARSVFWSGSSTSATTA